jgi:hypothetical protein
MEWDAINKLTIEQLQQEKNIESGRKEFFKWMRENASNLITVQKKIISLAEEQNILYDYEWLNYDFKKRLDDENRYQDNKEVGDKRPMLESPIAPDREPWLVEDDGHREDNDSTTEKEEEEDVKIEDEKTNAPNSPSKKKKKNKRRGKKK